MLPSSRDIDNALQVIRDLSLPHDAWNEFLSLCHKVAPSKLWTLLPNPPLKQDVSRAVDWLSSELAKMPDASGIYFGLDTLNMAGGKGTNLQIGGSKICEVASNDLGWLEGELTYGEEHLIRDCLICTKSIRNWNGRIFTNSQTTFFF
jgi:hypothetical protein